MIEQFAKLSVQGRCFPVATPFSFFSKSDERLSLIYGSNGSGKSTLSRAFNVLSSPCASDLAVTAVDINGNPLRFSELPSIAVLMKTILMPMSKSMMMALEALFCLVNK